MQVKPEAAPPAGTPPAAGAATPGSAPPPAGRGRRRARRQRRRKRPRQSRKAAARPDGAVLHPAPDRRDRHRDPDGHARGRLAHRARHRAVPVPGPAEHPRHRDLPGRLGGGGGAVGGHADRAGSQRRRQHDLHEVVEHQRRPHAARRQLRGRRRPGHRQRPHAEPGHGRPRRGCRRRSIAAGRHRQEAEPQHPDGDLALLARRDATTRTSSSTTAASTCATSCSAFPASPRSISSAAPTTACAIWLRARQAGQARADAGRRDLGDQGAEPPGAGRADRRRALAQGPAVHLHRGRARAA